VIVSEFVNWLLFIHILSAITFFLAHGAAAAMVFRIGKETDPERMRAMLDLSITGVPVYLLSFLILGITGIAMPFFFETWHMRWLWVSIALMLGVAIWMFRIGQHYQALRKLLGLPYREENKDQPAQPPASDEEIIAHARQTTVAQSVIAGYVIPAFVLWLMVFRPF
jgi:hypothetical protein